MNFCGVLQHRLRFLSLASSLSLLALIVAWSPPARAMDGKAFNDFTKSLDKLRREDAAKAVADGRQFAQNNELTPVQTSLLYYAIANIQQSSQKEPTAAIATLDEGLQKLGTHSERFRLIGLKAVVLATANRAGEAETLLTAQWPDISKTTYHVTLLPTYVNALQKAGKHDIAIQVTRAVLEERLESEIRKPDVFRSLVDQLLAVGRKDEAAGWGKLYFMACPFDERSLQGALQMLSRIWTVQQVSPAKVQELLDAQQDPNKPSPLQDVKLPVLDGAALRKRLETARMPEERIALLLVLGESQSAMTQARRLMLDKPESPLGVLQVCRVFKARDLKLKRANDFLEFYKTGQGANPLAEFEQETQKPQVG